ncbi:hypothetical protein BC749_102524 [Flavobacterium araucananum]|uniref:Uncharacterized protein n=1 Tax=Flavobacterium araucananum TaxID=946678 RepID=A0A227P9L3_9FLAO|nr:hypothetical protein [Flavobacterium araucananum]OXG06607.1 hypothetical protein B0A64_10895 [Flavobacterium araucananum]PWK00956.1 hypothetical protein BC749_102524 [Flavobacterium araucananum]
MDTSFYLQEFRKVVDQLDSKLLNEKSIEVSVGIYLDSVFIKLYKKSWASNSEEPLTAQSRIFFSVWIHDSTIQKQKIMYNIHALKLRNLKGYSIQSRKFAEIFRDHFKEYKHKWENVTVNHGPLTLMEGWIKLDLENLQEEVLKLAINFLAIEHLVDDTLNLFKLEI